MVSKFTQWVVGALLVALGILAVLYGFQKHVATKAKADVSVYKEAATTLSSQIQTQQQSFRIDLDAIDKVQSSKEQMSQSSAKIKEKVDAVSKKVEAGQISSDAADAAYINSMWETYCQGASDPACPASSTSK